MHAQDLSTVALDTMMDLCGNPDAFLPITIITETHTSTLSQNLYVVSPSKAIRGIGGDMLQPSAAQQEFQQLCGIYDIFVLMSWLCRTSASAVERLC